MTEIINNNNGMAFDLLETGNSANVNLGNGKFNSFFSDIGKKENSDFQDEEITSDKLSSLEGTMNEILNILKDSDLDIGNDVIADITEKLKNFFSMFETVETANDNRITNTRSGVENNDFLHLMRFLDKLKEILSINTNTKKPREKEINRVLDQITTKLNDHIKAHSRSNAVLTKENKHTTLEAKGGSENKIVMDGSVETKLLKSNALNKNEVLQSNTNPKAIANSELMPLKLRDGSNKSKIKIKPLSKVLDGSKNIDGTSNALSKVIENKSEVLSQQSINNSLSGKDLIAENNLLKQNIHSTAKLDMNNAPILEKSQRPLSSNNDTNNRLLDNLNMLSKTWGNKLIEKIEKSIADGIEKLEITLTPKSLGKLNVIINMQDSVAKINIIAESSSVAALLGESETKLSQMMEANGLKLASLQTLTQQFGHNKKGKEQPQNLALSKKKDNIEDKVKSGEEIINERDQNEGLNLIA